MASLPDGLTAARGHPRLVRDSVIEMVTPADRAVVARLWWQARSSGLASASVHLLDADPGKATLSIFDLRSRLGVLVVVIVDGATDSVTTAGLGRPVPAPSRFSRIIKDGTARILEIDSAFEAMLGWSSADLVGQRTLELIHPDDRDTAVEHWIQMCDFPGPSRPARLRHLTREGRWVWLEVTNHNRLDDPAHGDVVSDIVDISDEVSALDALRARQQLLEQVTETVPIGLLHADLDGYLLYANYRLTEITGLHSGSHLDEWPGVATPHHRTAVRAAVNAALQGSPTQSVIDMIAPGGEILHCALSIRPLLDHLGAVVGVTGSVEDVTATVTERRELEVRAATDALTSCLNRMATMTMIRDSLEALEQGLRTGGVAVIFVDVDNLKEINDRLGHAAGDALLVEVASRLRAAVRARDVVGRFGGDEFVVVAPHVASRDQALSVAQWVASRTMRQFVVDGTPVDIRASLGVAWTGQAGVQAEWLVRQADEAMYQSKRDGRCEPVLAGEAGV
jgi:diguanylate cyclase (GGDEF)-like protein/PAS domain S-box-containing protein